METKILKTAKQLKTIKRYGGLVLSPAFEDSEYWY